MLVVPSSDGLGPATEGVIIGTATTDPKLVEYEAKAFSLRRACVFLLFFSVACARPWPSVGWLGMLASLAVFGAFDGKASLLCRTRLARFLAFVVAVVAGYSVVSLAMWIHAGKPQAIAETVHETCLSMPVDTFAWGYQTVSSHKCMSKGLAFFSRHMPKDAPNMTSIVPVTSNNSASFVVAQDKEAWSQPAVCNQVSHIVARFGKMAMIASAVAHLLLFFSALCVVKRASLVRCAAYRAGLLTWKCKCKYACRGNTSNAVVKPAAGAAAPAAKEMA